MRYICDENEFFSPFRFLSSFPPQTRELFTILIQNIKYMRKCCRQQYYISFNILYYAQQLLFLFSSFALGKNLKMKSFAYSHVKVSGAFFLFKRILNFKVKNNSSSEKFVGSWDRFSISLLLFRKLMKLLSMIYDLNSMGN